MKKMLVMVALACASVFAAEAKALKVLMIGNSFTASAMKQTPAVAKAMGCSWASRTSASVGVRFRSTGRTSRRRATRVSSRIQCR